MLIPFVEQSLFSCQYDSTASNTITCILLMCCRANHASEWHSVAFSNFARFPKLSRFSLLRQFRLKTAKEFGGCKTMHVNNVSVCFKWHFKRTMKKTTFRTLHDIVLFWVGADRVDSVVEVAEDEAARATHLVRIYNLEDSSAGTILLGSVRSILWAVTQALTRTSGRPSLVEYAGSTAPAFLLTVLSYCFQERKEPLLTERRCVMFVSKGMTIGRVANIFPLLMS